MTVTVDWFGGFGGPGGPAGWDLLEGLREVRVVARSRTTLTVAGLLDLAAGPVPVHRKTYAYGTLAAALGTGDKAAVEHTAFTTQADASVGVTQADGNSIDVDNESAKHASNALEQITQLMRRGATASHIAGLGASVQSDVAAGLTPDAALEVRARGVMSLLPSPAAAAALAPRGGRP